MFPSYAVFYVLVYLMGVSTGDDWHSFEAQKRADMRNFNFGLGKRTDSNRYMFGLGKRPDHYAYSFGLGKRGDLNR